MKGGASSLNPYAASYIPLSKRGGTDESKDFKILANQLESGNHSVWFGHEPNRMWTQGQHQNPSQSYVHGAESVQVAQISNTKDHPGGEFYASSSFNPHEMSGKSSFSEESDMDLAYLQMTFPGISEESLSDVYLANKGDLDSTVDMLNQLEIYPEFSEKLPDTLDIGDVPESGSSSEVASQNVTGKAGASTSGSSISAFAN
ncbi:polyadenylate-binding protein-interacting protein 6 isoform X2 [Olea europaea var. sylvestris]|uniref:Polyadenylate-binding -interacting 5-like n=2 Tax=Olea europaea subsp. europaea TaxID=158383 RepID=A0A8S0Q1M0_OLEEU|nr:polyadenylate-binding protein-interacting protein 6 isoform X2 [Olea europaea var. sylvestris]CAA2960749.1 polyadenylate-binding -interacting 5-like [Olea europaea subsp. europaea]